LRKSLLLLILTLFSSCGGGYSFTGADVGEAQTVTVDFFPNNADLVNPQLSQSFTEKLRDNFVQQTPLELNESGGDLLFQGTITDYVITPINAQAGGDNVLGGTVAQSRLTIGVNVIFTNRVDPDKSFERRFTRFADFDSNVDLSQVEDELVEQITQELSENILNAAIGNW
jgi:hypothetical protein